MDDAVSKRNAYVKKTSFFAKRVMRFVMDTVLTEIPISLLPQRIQHLQLLQQIEAIGPQSFTLFVTKHSVVAPDKQGLVVNQRLHTPFRPDY